jgi:16S rRNA (guanine527-N7)-methyltransferase
MRWRAQAELGLNNCVPKQELGNEDIKDVAVGTAPRPPETPLIRMMKQIINHETPEPEPLTLLTEGVAALGLELAPNILEQLQIYLEELKLWNAKTNLTGLKTDRDIVIKHFLDSLAVLPFLDGVASLVDLGSGGGFPGLVLKLARPQLALTLVEARDRKAAFLEYLVARFTLTGAHVVQTHLTPHLAQKWQPKVAAVVSRAAFILPRLLELAAPLLAPGGVVLALKGVHLPFGELEAAVSAGQLLGLGPLEKHKYFLPISGEPRLLILARKT